MHGDDDRTVGYQQSVVFYKALRDACAAATLHLLEGVDHGTDLDRSLERRPPVGRTAFATDGCRCDLVRQARPRAGHARAVLLLPTCEDDPGGSVGEGGGGHRRRPGTRAACARAAVQRMREQGDGGRLLLVGSPAGQRGNLGQTAYAAAKAGIAAMARTWSMECARAGITVNAVVPVAATAMTASVPWLAPHVEALERGEPLPPPVRQALGFGTPEDAAGLVVFLASDAAAQVTGQCIGIGGDRLSLWSHPQEVRVAYADGGWSADAIAATWATTVGERPETVGIPAPELPG